MDSGRLLRSLPSRIQTYDNSFEDFPWKRMRLELVRFVVIPSFVSLPLLKPFFDLELKAFRNCGFLRWRLLQSFCTLHDLSVQLQGLELVAVIKRPGDFRSATTTMWSTNSSSRLPSSHLWSLSSSSASSSAWPLAVGGLCRCLVTRWGVTGWVSFRCSPFTGDGPAKPVSSVSVTRLDEEKWERRSVPLTWSLRLRRW